LISANSAIPVTEAEILLCAEMWALTGRRVAIATVVETFGSSPRPVGSHLVVEESGLFYGSVSAGCVEGEVITEALDAISDGNPRFLEFDITDETSWRSGLSCGGRISVHIVSINRDYLSLISRVNLELAAHRTCALFTPLEGGTPYLLLAMDKEIVRRLREGSGIVLGCGGRFFMNCYRHSPRLIIVGAVHIAQALVPMATLSGFDVTVVDPREVYTTSERFPQAHLDIRWPGEAFDEIGLNASTAVVVLTHDPKIDDAALWLALNSDCFYVGALGSRATQARRVKRLMESGITAEMLERLRSPIGLDIAAVSPAEIAVSIISEIILARGQKPVRPNYSVAASISCASYE
jgi:xanthine dehydrogenase accessory factor